MKTKLNKLTGIILMLPLLLLGFNCAEPHTQRDYLPLLKELHIIECNQLKKHNVDFVVMDTTIYSFRAIAFDLIMTRQPDPRLIAHYEDLCQKLAAMEYEMDDSEKLTYRKDYNAEYLKKCY